MLVNLKCATSAQPIRGAPTLTNDKRCYIYFSMDHFLSYEWHDIVNISAFVGLEIVDSETITSSPFWSVSWSVWLKTLISSQQVY